MVVMAWEHMEEMKVGQNIEVESSDQSGNITTQGPSRLLVDQASRQYSTIQQSHIAPARGAEAAPIPVLPDGDFRSEDRIRAESKPLEDLTDIEEVIHLDVAKIPVKKLRVVVPRLRVACYLREEEICGKKKMKNMWNNRPENWPAHVPFKDPNNKGTDGHKAGKEELVLMYEFLKGIYLKMPRDDFMSQSHSSASGMTMPPTPSIPHSIFPKEEAPDTVMETHHHQPNFQIKQEVVSPPANQMVAQFMVPTSAPMQTQTLPSRQEMSVTLGQESLSRFQQQGTPLYDLHERINNKLETVQIMVKDDQGALLKLREVHQDVVEHLFQNAHRMEVCCAFLDAGHQFETLLDVVLAFGKETALDVLRQGCQELLDKFAPQRDAQTQSSPHMQHNGMVFTAQTTSQPTSLPMPNGDHYIPTTASLMANHKAGPKINPMTTQKRDTPSPSQELAGKFSYLGLNMRKVDLSSINLGTIVETRENIDSVPDSEDKKDLFDMLLGEEDQRPLNQGPSKVVVEETNLSEKDVYKMLFENHEGLENPVTKDANLSETVMDDVLGMENDYSNSDFKDLTWEQMILDTGLLKDDAEPSMTLSTMLSPNSPPQANSNVTQTATIVSDPAVPEASFHNLPPQITLPNNFIAGAFGTVPPYQGCSTAHLNTFNQNIGSPDSIPTTVVDFSEIEDDGPERPGGKRFKMSSKGTKGSKRLSYKSWRKGGK